MADRIQKSLHDRVIDEAVKRLNQKDFDIYSLCLSFFDRYFEKTSIIHRTHEFDFYLYFCRKYLQNE
jgi:hypothetical protein